MCKTLGHLVHYFQFEQRVVACYDACECSTNNAHSVRRVEGTFVVQYCAVLVVIHFDTNLERRATISIAPSSEQSNL